MSYYLTSGFVVHIQNMYGIKNFCFCLMLYDGLFYFLVLSYILLLNFVIDNKCLILLFEWSLFKEIGGLCCVKKEMHLFV